jgi:hypothetical protein
MILDSTDRCAILHKKWPGEGCGPVRNNDRESRGRLWPMTSPTLQGDWGGPVAVANPFT